MVSAPSLAADWERIIDGFLSQPANVLSSLSSVVVA
jgi:hypothetical protein